MADRSVVALDEADLVELERIVLDRDAAAKAVNAIAELADDVGAVLPYLNATIKGGRYSPRAPAFSFGYEGHRRT